MNRKEWREKIEELELTPEVKREVGKILDVSEAETLTEADEKKIRNLLELEADFQDTLADAYEGLADGITEVSETIGELVSEEGEEKEED